MRYFAFDQGLFNIKSRWYYGREGGKGKKNRILKCKKNDNPKGGCGAGQTNSNHKCSKRPTDVGEGKKETPCSARG
jgi:hypothetical protein